MTTVAAARRPASPDDALGGVVPREVVRPTSVEEVAEVLRAAHADGLTVVPVGSRSKTSWAAPPSSCDLLLDTTGLDRIVEHVAGDLVVIAEAGVRLADLQSSLAEHGQLLGLDPPEPGATLGGVVSANASGPRRLAYGTVARPAHRHHRRAGRRHRRQGRRQGRQERPPATTSASSTPAPTARSGSSSRRPGGLHPLPRRDASSWSTCPTARRPDRCHRAQPVDPDAVRGGAGSAPRAVRAAGRGFESIAESVAAQADAARALLGGGSASDEVPDGFGARPGGPDDVVLRIAHVPTGLPTVPGRPARRHARRLVRRDGRHLRSPRRRPGGHGAPPAARGARPGRRHRRRPARSRTASATRSTTGAPSATRSSSCAG
jgi:glycolate oxidase FAD binding subunit